MKYSLEGGENITINKKIKSVQMREKEEGRG